MLDSAGAKIVMRSGRYYVHGPEADSEKIEQALERLIGISGWARACTCDKTVSDVVQACVAEGKALAEKGCKTFKIEARRADKSFPLDSYQIQCDCGEAVLAAAPDLSVDVHKPECKIRVEIREKAYIYSGSRKGLGGLPTGTAGRGLLLLSGGIDSPVAGFLMALRGMSLNAVHFHSYPYTSIEARKKVESLAGILAEYSLGLRLHIVGFTKIQMRIKERSPLPWSTVLLRMAMMECAEKIALQTKCKCLITGESLSQVASQTIENLSCSECRITLPVLRPLIGEDKEGIIRKAEKIGTYKTSILPYEDCCVLFSPPHPILQGDPKEASKLYESLELGELLSESLGEMETVKLQ
jgi:thiamine biosynthesis protein ThiI